MAPWTAAMRRRQLPAFRPLDVLVLLLASNDVAVVIGDDGPLPTAAAPTPSAAHSTPEDQGEYEPHRTDDQEDQSNGVDVEAVLVRAGRDCEVQDRPTAMRNRLIPMPGMIGTTSFVPAK